MENAQGGTEISAHQRSISNSASPDRPFLILRCRLLASWLDSLTAGAIAVIASALIVFLFHSKIQPDTYLPIILFTLAIVFIDCITLGSGGLLTLLAVSALMLFGWNQVIPQFSFWGMIAIGIGVSMSTVYHVVSVWLVGTTLGKRCLGISVTKTDGSRIGLVGAALRQIFKPLTLLSFLAPIIPLSVCNRRQLIHDRLFGAAVDFTRNKPVLQTMVQSATMGLQQPRHLEATVSARLTQIEHKPNDIIPTAACATLTQRIASSLIDAAVFGEVECLACIVSQLIAAKLWIVFSSIPQELMRMLWIPIVFLPLFLVPPIFMALLESSPLQATPGKLILGLQVCSLNGNPLNFLQALEKQFVQAALYLSLFFPTMIACSSALLLEPVRPIVAVGSVAFFYLAYATILCVTFVGGRQTIIDKISKRLIVREKLVAPVKLPNTKAS